MRQGSRWHKPLVHFQQRCIDLLIQFRSARACDSCQLKQFGRSPAASAVVLTRWRDDRWRKCIKTAAVDVFDSVVVKEGAFRSRGARVRDQGHEGHLDQTSRHAEPRASHRSRHARHRCRQCCSRRATFRRWMRQPGRARRRWSSAVGSIAQAGLDVRVCGWLGQVPSLEW